MNLLAQYTAAIENGDIEEDTQQRAVLVHMQRLADALASQKPWWGRLGRSQLIKGIYLYGSVGVGKTYLVDLFYQYIPEEKKARYHFHHFMQQIDLQLRKAQGVKDPLRQIAKKIAQTTRVLCFDEFLVHDVAYAMILAELFQALHAYGVILVISSNTRPDDLYLGGVQRARFIPVITLINKECDVLYLNKPKDYRQGHQPLLDAYMYPLNAQNKAKMQQQFDLLAPEALEHGAITVQSRDIPFIKCSVQAIWFSFSVVCNLPRSQLDYLEIAQRFDTVFLSDIPLLTPNHTLQVILFIHFIDVMYDQGIKVIISAAVPVEDLYTAGEMKDTFKRTLSRLMEMQSVDYLSRHPRRVLVNMDNEPL